MTMGGLMTMQNNMFEGKKLGLFSDYPVSNYFVHDNGTHELQFAVSGWKKNEITVKIEDDSLVIEGKKEQKSPSEEVEASTKQIIHNKIAQRNFSISFKISEKIDITKIASNLENGILSIKLPLSEEIKKKNRVIEIK